MTYGRRTQIARERLGLSVPDLAARAGLSDTTVRRVEAGQYSVSFYVIDDIAKALGISLDWIAGRTLDPYSHKRKLKEEGKA